MVKNTKQTKTNEVKQDIEIEPSLKELAGQFTELKVQMNGLDSEIEKLVQRKTNMFGEYERMKQILQFRMSKLIKTELNIQTSILEFNVNV